MRQPVGKTSLIAFGTTAPASAIGPCSAEVMRSPKSRPIPPAPTTEKKAARPMRRSPIPRSMRAHRRRYTGARHSVPVLVRNEPGTSDRRAALAGDLASRRAGIAMLGDPRPARALRLRVERDAEDRSGRAAAGVRRRDAPVGHVEAAVAAGGESAGEVEPTDDHGRLGAVGGHQYNGAGAGRCLIEPVGGELGGIEAPVRAEAAAGDGREAGRPPGQAIVRRVVAPDRGGAWRVA